MSNNLEKIPAAYRRPEYSSEPEWDDVSEQLDILNVSDVPAERAEDVASNLASSGQDIYYLSLAVHQVLVPQIESMPTEYTMKVESPDGSSSREMLAPEARSELFELAAKLIKDLDKKREGLNDSEFLERASNIIALSIVLAHPYADGNGRTARFIGGLIRNGRLEDDDLRVLSRNRPAQGFRINSYLPRGTERTPEQVLEAAASIDIPLSNKNEYEADTSVVFSTPYS